MTSPVRAAGTRLGNGRSIAGRVGRAGRARARMRRSPYWHRSTLRLRSRSRSRDPLWTGPRGHSRRAWRSSCRARRLLFAPDRTIAPRCVGRRSRGGDEEAMSPAGRVPARGRSLMVARLVTSDRDLRCGPFARPGVRSLVRGRRPECPRFAASRLAGTMPGVAGNGNERYVPGLPRRWSGAPAHHPQDVRTGLQIHRGARRQSGLRVGGCLSRPPS
jgi:hypothetical protein